MLDQIGEHMNLGRMFIQKGQSIPQNRLQTAHY